MASSADRPGLSCKPIHPTQRGEALAFPKRICQGFFFQWTADIRQTGRGLLTVKHPVSLCCSSVRYHFDVGSSVSGCPYRCADVLLERLPREWNAFQATWTTIQIRFAACAGKSRIRQSSHRFIGCHLPTGKNSK